MPYNFDGAVMIMATFTVPPYMLMINPTRRWSGMLPPKSVSTLCTIGAFDQSLIEGKVIRLWNNAPDDDKPIDAVGKIQVEVDGQDPVSLRANKIGDEIKFDQATGLIIASMVSLNSSDHSPEMNRI